MKNGFSPIKVIIMICLLAFLGFIAYIAFPFIYLAIVGPQQEIRGNSMEPNYKNNQFVTTKKVDELHRGDVVVFYHKLPDVMESEFTKRIVGLPGETIKVENNKVYINGEILPEPYLAPNATTYSGSFLEDGKTITIPEDSYFLMGDNRPHSTDSREWGFILRKDILRMAK